MKTLAEALIEAAEGQPIIAVVFQDSDKLQSYYFPAGYMRPDDWFERLDDEPPDRIPIPADDLNRVLTWEQAVKYMDYDCLCWQWHGFVAWSANLVIRTDSYEEDPELYFQRLPRNPTPDARMEDYDGRSV